MDQKEVLSRYFGYENFREGQACLIDALLKKQDVLGIMPTGAGKSICYQVPAMLFSGLTIVVSPLISLMQNQVTSLVQIGIPAAYLNSSLSPKQMQMVMENARNGRYRLLYVAPERLASEEFVRFAYDCPISMLTVDEAHCISQWGQDFRPAYLEIPSFIRALSVRPLISAFTATATTRVQQDIISLLELQKPRVLVSGFDRENLYFEVLKPKNKIGALYQILANVQGQSGIVYCLTRKTVEAVCEALQAQSISATRYHAGLSDAERKCNLEDFLQDRVSVMVATNAFGMGIDKSNVSFVVHYNMPKDMESYYQEAGRAGRDGSKAKCTLLYSGQDVRMNQFLIENSGGENPQEQGEVRQKAQEYDRLKQMTFYATTSLCLRQHILQYFGEKSPSFCGFCSNCNTQYDVVDITIEAQKILSCIYRMKECFGATMVIDVLRGSKSDKVLRQKFDRLSTYGISEKSAEELRRIIQELLHRKILFQEEGPYPILKLTAASQDVLQGNCSLTMKKAIETKPAETGDAQSSIGEHAQLYTQLCTLRKTLASEHKIPTYMVFSNRALMDMCTVLPQNMQAFLSVSGVGEMKQKQYGPAFVEVISAYCQEKGSEACVCRAKRKERSVVLPQVASLNTVPTFEDACLLSELARKINEVLGPQKCSKISAQKIADWLVFQRYLQVVTLDDVHTRKEPTSKGLAAGIRVEERHIRGTQYQANLYPPTLQKFIIENVCNILIHNNE